MITDSYLCKNCGAPIAFLEGEESVKCEYCGTVNELKENEKAAPKETAKITVAEVSIKEQAEALLKRAYLFLEDGDTYQADEYFDKVLDLSPEEYRAYLGKLMLELSVTQEDEIAFCDVDLNRSGNYEKLLRFAPKKKKTVYAGYNRTIQNRLEEQARQEQEAEKQEEQERQKQLEESKREKAIYFARIKKTAIIVITLVLLFSGITVTVKKVSQHNTYEKGLAYLKSGDNVRAVEAFEAAGYEYKDVKEKIRKPAYEEAEKLFQEGTYLKAASYYIKANGYQDSTQKLRAISKSVSPINSIGDQIVYIKNDGNLSIPYYGEPGDELADSTMKELESLHDIVWLYASCDYKRTFRILLALKKDGTVICNGSLLEDHEPYKEVALWKDISKIWFINDNTIVGLKSNGDFMTTGNKSGYEPPDWKDLKDLKINFWGYSALGLRKDGTVVYDGKNSYGEGNVSSWENIKAIDGGGRCTLGLKKDGTVVTAGQNDSGSCDVSSWKDIIEVYMGDTYTFGLKNDGTVLTAGIAPQEVSDVSTWKDIISLQEIDDYDKVAMFGLKSDGTVLYSGTYEETKDIVSTWENIVYIQMIGDYYLWALQSDGTLLNTYDSTQLNLSDIYIAPIN